MILHPLELGEACQAIWLYIQLWQCRQAFEAQFYGSISRAGRVYRIRRGRRLNPDHDFFDLVMKFLT